MKKTTKLLSLFVFVIFFVAYIYIRVSLYLYDVEASELFSKISNIFQEESITLFSKCYCQKELVHINKHERFYEIIVENQPHSSRLFYSYRLDKQYFESLLFTCDLYNVLRRGPAQKVLSFSLDDDERVLNSLDEKIHFAYTHYPNWTLRFYHRSSLSHALKCQTQCKKRDTAEFKYDNVDFCSVNELPFNLLDKWSAHYMQEEMWRLLPIADDFVDVFSSRKKDSCMTNDEVSADIRWLRASEVSQIVVHKFNEDMHTSASLVGFKNAHNRRLARNIFSILTNEYLSNNWHWPDEKTIFKQFILPILEKNYTVQAPSKHKCIF